ncbi:MAG: tetratricopeptide repeat protein [Bacteroidota bacterium]
MKQLVKILIIAIAYFCVIQGFAQSDYISDSLNKELDNTHVISDKIDIYLALSKHVADTDINKAIYFTNNALILAKKTNSTSNLGLIYMYLGEFALKQDSIEVAEIMFKKAAFLLVEANKPEELILVYLSIGNRYIEKDNYAEAMKYYHKGIELSEVNNDKSRLPNLYNNLGIVYLNINNPEKALDLYSKALKLFEENNDTMNVAGTTTNIGSIYIQLGQYDIAETYYKRGYQLFKNFGNTEGMAHSQLKLGLLDMILMEFDSAAKYLSNSLKIQKELEVTYSGSRSFFIAETYINLGIVFIQLQNYYNAKEYLLEGYNIAQNTKQNRLISLAAKHLSSFFKESDKPLLALDYYQVFKQFSDSNFNEENVRRLTQVEMQYQFDTKLKEDQLKRRIQDQLQERKNLIYIIISVSLLFLLVIVILLLRLEKIKKRKTELEKKTLADKLEHANKELTTHVMYLLRKNEFIISIAEKLKLAKLDAKAENKKIISDLIKELESNSAMISWEDFEIRFQEVYTGFYKKLNINFSDLTPNELRLCAFLRLNMTTKEIAAITYQSTNSIVVARHRLRKKLNIEKEENLISFLSKI